MYSAISDYFSWLFRPKRFLFGSDLKQHYRVRGWETLCFVDEPSEVAAVNAATGSVFLGGAGNEFLSALLGYQSVFLLDHAQHKLARRIMSPLLTAQSVQRQQEVVADIVQEHLEQVHSCGWFSAGSWSRRLTMRVICKLVLGVDDVRQFERILSRFEATTGYLANIVSYKRRFWRPRGLFSIGTLTALLVKRIDNELYPIIQKAKGNTAKQPKTILDLLIAGQSEHGYSDEFIRDNLVALLAAGYDTTGSALSWLLFWYGKSTSRAELISAFKNGDDAYLHAFRNEVLRYCPPVEILPRRISAAHRDQAEHLVDGLADLKESDSDGPMVCPFVHRVHHNESIWQDPSLFEPSRFTQGKRYSKNDFIPFGAGHRMCIGMSLGRMILDQALCALLKRNLTVELKRTRFNPVRRNVSIWPGFNLKVQINGSGESQC